MTARTGTGGSSDEMARETRVEAGPEERQSFTMNGSSPFSPFMV